MERKLLTVLMLAAFGTNGLNGSLIDPNAKPSPATPYVLQSRYPQGGAVANVGKRLVEEVATIKALASLDDGLGGISFSLVSKASGQAATLTAKVRNLAGKALNATKSGLTKGKKAVVGIPSAVVNTTLGGKMRSLAGDYAALTADVTGSGFGFPVAAAQLFGNVYNNKIAALKVTAATAATAYVGFKGATWVAGKAKSAYQARLAKSAPAAAVLEVETPAETPATTVDGAASTSSVVTAPVVESSSAVAPVVAPAVARAVVVEDPMVAVLAKLNVGQELDAFDCSVVESAFGAFWIENMVLEENQHKVRKAFMFGKCKISVNTDQHRVMNSIICDTKKPQVSVKSVDETATATADSDSSILTVESAESATTTPTDSLDKQPAVGRSLMGRARSLASRWWTPSKTSDDAAVETPAALEEDATTTAITVAPEAPKASRWSAWWWSRSAKAPVAQEETAEQTAARLLKEKAAHEEAATRANQRPKYEFTGK